MREKGPNTEFFLARIFLYSARIQELRTRKNSVFEHFPRGVLCAERSIRSLKEVIDCLSRDLVIVREGKETKEFWELLGGKEEYASMARLAVIFFRAVLLTQ